MDTAVKQRLLGGIVLAAGAAILLPLMLDGSGARLLSRLEPIPAKPVTTTAAQTQPKLNQQQQDAEEAVNDAHSEDTQFYPMGKPLTPGETAQTVVVAKTPEQIAAEQAARERAAQLLSSKDEISVEEAQAQKQAADKAERELLKQQAAMPASIPDNNAPSVVDQDKADKLAADKAKKLEADKALAYLEGKDSQAQKIAEKQAAEKVAKQKADEEAKAARLMAEKEKAKAEKIAADKEKAKADKLAADKEKADKEKADKLAAEKANPKTDIWFGGTGDPHLQAAEPPAPYLATQAAA